MIELLLAILIAALLVWLAFWVIDATGVPHPINVIAKVVVAIIVIAYLLQRQGLLSSL